jgi:hypothetical protein
MIEGTTILDGDEIELPASTHSAYDDRPQMKNKSILKIHYNYLAVSFFLF